MYNTYIAKVNYSKEPIGLFYNKLVVYHKKQRLYVPHYNQIPYHLLQPLLPPQYIQYWRMLLEKHIGISIVAILLDLYSIQNKFLHY